jgi:hypothetical protein
MGSKIGGSNMLAKVVVHNGKIINLGDWDYMIVKDNDGNDVINNPMPEGAEIQEIEISYTADGRIVMANDYRELRKAEYPSIGDQLDAIWKGGTALEEMKVMVMAVKEKYLKA